VHIKSLQLVCDVHSRTFKEFYESFSLYRLQLASNGGFGHRPGGCASFHDAQHDNQIPWIECTPQKHSITSHLHTGMRGDYLGNFAPAFITTKLAILLCKGVIPMLSMLLHYRSHFAFCYSIVGTDVHSFSQCQNIFIENDYYSLVLCMQYKLSRRD